MKKRDGLGGGKKRGGSREKKKKKALDRKTLFSLALGERFSIWSLEKFYHPLFSPLRHSLLDGRRLCAAFGAAPRLRDERKNELRGPPSPRGGRGHGRDCVVLGSIFDFAGIALAAGSGAPPRLRRGRRGLPQQPQAGPGRHRGAVCLAEDCSCAGERNYVKEREKERARERMMMMRERRGRRFFSLSFLNLFQKPLYQLFSLSLFLS